MQKKLQLSLISVALISSLNANDVIDLEAVTVTSATKTSQSITDVTSNINVITSAEIEERHYTTVVEALNSISGINFSSNGGLGQTTSLYLRGFDSQRVLVLIDGVRYNDITGLSGAPFEHLMVGDIEQIEVVKGAQSGIWGADASAGVINIITKSAKKGYSASVNAEYGSFNTKKYGISASYKSDNYYVKVSSQKVDSDGFSAKAPRGEDLDSFEDDGYKNTTSTIKAGFNINETNKIDISHTLIDATTSYDGYVSDPVTFAYDAVASANSVESTTTKDSFTKINFNHIDSFNELDIYAQKSTFAREYPQGWTKNYDGEVLEYGLKSNISYREKDFLVLGVDYKSFEHKNNLDKKYNNKAIFLTNSNSVAGLIGGKTIISESIRYDAYDKFDNKTTGKLGVKHFHDAIEGFITSVNIGTAYNVPTLYNLYDATYGNTTLTPESTKSFDISAQYKSLKITYFNSVITDTIDYYDPDGWSGPIAGKYHNIVGDSKIKGYEFEYSDEVIENFLVNANYTYLDAKDKDGKTLARRASSSANFSVDYYGVDDLHLGVNTCYIGERYDSADKQGKQTGKYAVVNFVLNYDINKNFKTYLKVDNITDKYYQVVDGYASAPRSAYIGLIATY